RPKGGNSTAFNDGCCNYMSAVSPCVFDHQPQYSLYTGRLTPSGSFRGSQNPAWQGGGLLRLYSRNAL
ncbi:hypothetical protein M1719_23810, partial [Salmonella enterica subsp. enterica serovar Give]|nr:hypothetical protein [Salmonella enterica subsp. enterica serovar Give]